MGSAQGAVDSLLGRLTSALVEEAQLLGGVRGDVQFIKDEMESMNGFLMHVAEATGDDGEDHQVRAWMKQVADVAYSSQNCVDLYVHSLGPRTAAGGNNGVLGFVRRLPRLVWTLPTRHRLATQIRELKIRAREVGERRQRYGVEAPANARRVMEPKGQQEALEWRRAAWKTTLGRRKMPDGVLWQKLIVLQMTMSMFLLRCYWTKEVIVPAVDCSRSKCSQF